MALEKAKIKQSFGQAATTYDGVAHLQRQIGRELLSAEALEGLHGVVLDVGCGTGFLTQQLLPHCQGVTLLALDLAQTMLVHCREKVATQVMYLCADIEKLPLHDQSVDTIFSNVALQWCYPIDVALHALHDALVPGGALLFSTFSAGTLCELKEAWAQVDTLTHVNDFYTQEALLLALERAGFTVVTVRGMSCRQQYASVLDLMHELKQIGAHNVSAARSKTLTTKTALKTLMNAYPQNDIAGVEATFEVTYVSARKALR